jgi:hypothetical protein
LKKIPHNPTKNVWEFGFGVLFKKCLQLAKITRRKEIGKRKRQWLKNSFLNNNKMNKLKSS